MTDIKIKPQTPNSTRVLACARTHFLHRRFPEERDCTKSYGYKETKPPGSLQSPLIPSLPPEKQAGTNAREHHTRQPPLSTAVDEVMTPQQHLHQRMLWKGEKDNPGLGPLSPRFSESLPGVFPL